MASADRADPVSASFLSALSEDERKEKDWRDHARANTSGGDRRLSVSLFVCLSVCLSVRTRVRMHARSPEEVDAQKEATKSGKIEAPEAESKELRASA